MQDVSWQTKTISNHRGKIEGSAQGALASSYMEEIVSGIATGVFDPHKAIERETLVPAAASSECLKISFSHSSQHLNLIASGSRAVKAVFLLAKRVLLKNEEAIEGSLPDTEEGEMEITCSNGLSRFSSKIPSKAINEHQMEIQVKKIFMILASSIQKQETTDVRQEQNQVQSKLEESHEDELSLEAPPRVDNWDEGFDVDFFAQRQKELKAEEEEKRRVLKRDVPLPPPPAFSEAQERFSFRSDNSSMRRGRGRR